MPTVTDTTQSTLLAAINLPKKLTSRADVSLFGSPAIRWREDSSFAGRSFFRMVSVMQENGMSSDPDVIPDVQGDLLTVPRFGTHDHPRLWTSSSGLVVVTQVATSAVTGKRTFEIVIPSEPVVPAVR